LPDTGFMGAFAGNYVKRHERSFNALWLKPLALVHDQPPALLLGGHLPVLAP
jgi:hypothetical protein